MADQTKRPKLENLDFTDAHRLQTLDCVLCGSRDFKFLVLEHGIPVVRCRSCSLVMANPRPSPQDLDRFYAQYFPPESAPLWQQQMSEIFYEEGLRKIESLKNQGFLELGDPPAILDIGCGMGFFLDLMRQVGWETFGVEPSPDAAHHARSTLHLKVYEGYLSDFQSGHQYDVVSLWYVLEHVPNPQEILRKAHQLLKPGGLLIVRIPNQTAAIDVWLARFGLKQYYLMNPPRHLFDYSPKTIAALMEKAGFFGIEVQNGIPRKTGTWLELLRRNLWYVFFQAVYRLSGARVIRGSSMTVYARKPR